MARAPDVRKYSAEEVLSLPHQGQIARLLRSSELNLIEILRLLSGQPGAWLLQDDRGVRFLNRNQPPPSMGQDHIARGGWLSSCHR